MAREEKNTAIYVAYDDVTPYDPTVPEKNLLVAVLVSAIADLKKPGEIGRKALEFFLSPEDDYIFSFVSICEYLSLDPKLVLAATGLKNGSQKSRLNGKAQESHDEVI